MSTWLEIGDVVFIVGYKFIICADFIASNIDFDKNVKGKNLGRVVFPEYKCSDKKTKTETEYFYRMIDLGVKAPDLPVVELLPPQQYFEKEEQSMLLSMGSSLTMCSATVLVAAYSGLAAYYRGTDISYVVPTFIMAGSMVLSSAMWPVLLRKSNNKRAKKNSKIKKRNIQSHLKKHKQRLMTKSIL